MAQLKDSIITGDLRVTGTIYGSTSLNNLTDADDLKAIEALSGTSGILKKTAANTWTLDTTNYTTNVGTITGVTGSNGLTGSGTSGSVTIQHAAPSQSPAKTTSAVYPITIDQYGHITAVGSAQTILTLGTGASNAAAGNHDHDSVYVNVSGDAMSGRLTMTSGKPINQILTGSGTTAQDRGASTSPRYIPAKWTFNTGLTEVTNGDIFTIKVPVAGHTYGVYMSIDDGSHYYPVVLNNTARATTQYPINTYIQVIYESTGSAASMTPLAGADTANGSAITGGVFRVLNYYDANTTYSAMSTAEMQTGTASSSRSIQARYLKAAFLGDTSNTNPIFKTGSANGTISVYGTDIAVKGLGTAAYTATTDYATSGHTHTTSIAESNETNQLTLAFGTKYAITAGETSYIFTTPANPNTDIAALQSIASANKWRKITLGSDYFNTMGEALIPNYSATGQLYVNSQLEFNTEAGTLKATEYSVNGNATLQYNSTTESLDFVF